MGAAASSDPLLAGVSRSRSRDVTYCGLPSDAEEEGGQKPADQELPPNDKDDLPVAGDACRCAIPPRLRMVVTCVMLYVDMLLDGQVAVRMYQEGNPIWMSLLLTAIVVPQVLIWIFVRVCGKASLLDLCRITAFPCLGLLCGALASIDFGVTGPVVEVWLSNWPLLCCLNLEPLRLLLEGLSRGEEPAESTWAAVGEGLIEAPASACLTIYIALVTSAATSEPVPLLFYLSTLSSVISSARVGAKLHYYGAKEVSWRDWLQTFFLLKLPQTMSQVLAIALYAFCTRPLPHSMAELHSSSSFLVFVFLLVQLILNVQLLQTTCSPKMPCGVLWLFAGTMIFSSVPGFLPSIDKLRGFQAWLQFALVMFLVGQACLCTDAPAHLVFLWRHHAALVVAVVVSWLCALPMSIFGMSSPVASNEAAMVDSLEASLLAEDLIMCKLLLDAEGVKPLSERFAAFGPEIGQMEYLGMAVFEDKLYCCPFYATSVLVLNLAPKRVNFNHLPLPEPYANASKGGKWCGIAACGRKLYCVPDRASHVLVIDPQANPERACRLLIVPDLYLRAQTLFQGVRLNSPRTMAELGGKLYCPSDRLGLALVIDPGTGPEEEMCSLLGDVPIHLPPFPGDDELPAWVRVSTQKKEMKLLGYIGVAAWGGRLYCCPRTNDDGLLVIDPADGGTYSSIRLPAFGLETSWAGIVALEDRLYCCPTTGDEMIVIDPGKEDCKRIRVPPLGRSRSECSAIAAIHGKLYMARYSYEPVQEVLVYDPAATESMRFKALRPPPGCRVFFLKCFGYENHLVGMCAKAGELFMLMEQKRARHGLNPRDPIQGVPGVVSVALGLETLEQHLDAVREGFR